MNVRKAIWGFLKAFVLLIFITSVGIAGFMFFEGYTLLDAAYMTVITMSTVGYETIGELTDQGKVFVIFLIIFTLGSFLYAISSLTTFIIEGEIQSIFQKYKVNKDIAKMRGHVIICGLGRNGREAALELSGKGLPFIAIEQDMETIAYFKEHHESFFILQGDATEEESLTDANIKEAKGVITCLPDDAANVFVTLTARELNSKVRIVSRASHETTISKLRTAGADQVVLPNILGGRKMAKIVTNPALVEFMEVITGEGNPELDLQDIACGDNPEIIGKSLADLKIRAKTGVLVLGYKTQAGNFNLNPPADKVIQPGEILFILGTPDQIVEFRRLYQ